MSAIDINEDDFLVQMITDTGKINTKQLKQRFGISSGNAIVKNVLYVGDKRTKEKIKFKTLLSNLRKKIKKTSPSDVVSMIREAAPEGLESKVEQDPEALESRVEVLMGEDPEEEVEVPEALESLVDKIVSGQITVEEAMAEVSRQQSVDMAPAKLPASLPSRSAPSRSTEGFTIQGLKRNLIESTTGVKYLGSGTPLLEYLKTGTKPEGEVDRIALEHDIRYTTATSQQDVIDADKLFISRLNELASRKSSISDFLLSLVSAPAMTVKRFLGSIPLSPIDAAFVDYEENKKLPEREVLLAIQDELANDETLSEEATGFIFTPETRQALASASSGAGASVSADGQQTLSGSKKTPTPSLSPKPRVVPSLFGAGSGVGTGTGARKGHVEAVSREQMLQALKKEDEDRKMGLIYENDPDDYMDKPVPNHYLRPMFPTQWLDIAKLQQYQTPEYIKKEQAIWERNWQTPFQYGEGTPDNSVKDIQNIVERLARLEHELRYGTATRGLHPDQVNTGFRYGEPMTRTGVLPQYSVNPVHERWGQYQRVQQSVDMSKYQYTQRQNEPPRTKTIDRKQVSDEIKPSQEIQGQQKVYDELLTEGYPVIDIQNHYDRVYYDRRIRKRK